MYTVKTLSKHIKRNEREIRRLTRIEQQKGYSKKDDNETWNEFIHRKRIENRQNRLDSLVPDRKCPFCKAKKVRSRQWICLSRTLERKIIHNLRAAFDEFNHLGNAQNALIGQLIWTKTRPNLSEIQRASRVILLKKAICRACFVRFLTKKD